MNISEALYALLIGIVQGITEFLPVSSSAHLILTSHFFDGQTMPLSLNIALHLGTVTAVLVYFHKDWFEMAHAGLARLSGKRSFAADVLLPALLIGSIPAGVIGILWQDQIEQTLHHPIATIIPLALVGIAMWWFDKSCPTNRNLSTLTFKDALLVGLAQACALIPGTSRSGATILTGRLLGFDRQSAARFSFLLGTPAMTGAALLNAKEILQSLDDPTFYIGFLTSAVVGCFAIGFLLKFLKNFGFLAFAIYRVLLAFILAFILL
jgi:undecaprenyl-diphosphatase